MLERSVCKQEGSPINIRGLWATVETIWLYILDDISETQSSGFMQFQSLVKKNCKLPNAGSPARQQIILIKYRLAQYTSLLSFFIRIFSRNSIICDSMSFLSLFGFFFLNTCVYTCFWTGWFELNIFIFILKSKEFLTHINFLFYWLRRCL